MEKIFKNFWITKEIKNIKTYNFSDFNPYNKKIIKEWKNTFFLKDIKKLTSNNSYGKKSHNRYSFSPFPIIKEIEAELKYLNYTTIYISPHKEEIGIQKIKNCITHQYIKSINYNNIKFNELEKLIKTKEKVILFSHPQNWLFLTSRPEFIEFLHNNKEQIFCLNSTDYDSFFKKKDLPVFVNDNTINWKTGINFYTCPYKTKHFLPIFMFEDKVENCYNMLNLGNKQLYENDDIFTYKNEVKTCPCGKNYLEFDVVWHSKNDFRIPLEFAELLTDSYLNLQFIKKEGKITVYYRNLSGEMNQKDKNLIGDTLGDVDYNNKQYVLIGNGKKFPFCNIDGANYRIKDIVA